MEGKRQGGAKGTAEDLGVGQRRGWRRATATHVVPQRGTGICVGRYFDGEAVAGVKHDAHALVCPGNAERATDVEGFYGEGDSLLVCGELDIQHISPERVTAFRKYVFRARGV